MRLSISYRTKSISVWFKRASTATLRVTHKLLILITWRTWDTRENSGLETHLNQCKSSLTQVQPGPGCFLRSAKLETAPLRTKGISNQGVLSSRKTQKQDKLLPTEKERSWVIQPLIELASPLRTTIAFTTLVSWLLCSRLICPLLEVLASLVLLQPQAKVKSTLTHWTMVFQVLSPSSNRARNTKNHTNLCSVFTSLTMKSLQARWHLEVTTWTSPRKAPLKKTSPGLTSLPMKLTGLSMVKMFSLETSH